MRKFLIDGAAIFFSILASFSVENYREDLEKKQTRHKNENFK